MPRLTAKQIEQLALTKVANASGGIRYSALTDAISRASPHTPIGAIHGAIWDLHTKFPQLVSKPSRGLFVSASAVTPKEDAVVANAEQTTSLGTKIKEADFYKPFADWLKDVLDEVTVVSDLGGTMVRSKWGTPDVVGTYKPVAADLIKFDIEIVAAEIKIDPQQPIVAFGQAVAYRLFATKTYLALPKTLSEEDLSRVEALCMLFGIGLIQFNLDKDNPNFAVRVRAQRFPPDMFYVNEFAESLRKSDVRRRPNMADSEFAILLASAV